MDTLYTLIILALMVSVAYGIYAYVKSTFAVEPQRKSIESLKKNSIANEEYAEELTQFPEWKKKSPAPDPELPHIYNHDTLVLMARDPNWLYAYWEITATKQQQFVQQYGSSANYQPVLRVYDISNIDNFDGTNAHHYQDVEINDYANNWYLKVDGPARTYCVDYGYRLKDGRFITILRSNFVSTPRASMSDIIDDEWLPIVELYPDVPRYPASSVEQMYKQ
ncbi:DUF4912 domain-containing protein [Peptococcaceae bacterium 1198_IL3148]